MGSPFFMKNSKSFSRAVQAINDNGVLLVFPIANRKEPASIWSVLYPRSKMRWEWDDAGDGRLASLWRLKEELSRSGLVVYTKWYQGRATFFSREKYVQFAAAARSGRNPMAGLSAPARLILEVLQSDSPLSTKQIKRATDLVGKVLEPTYSKGLKELWNRFLIVGFGEVDDGAFPSLAVGAVSLLFEQLWSESLKLDSTEAYSNIVRDLGEASLWKKALKRQLSN